MENFRKGLTFKVKENEYEISIPNVGNLWDIEQMKAQLSGGMYGAVLKNTTQWSDYSLDNIDMFSYLSIMCPQLMIDMKVSSWKEMDPFDLKELREAYKNEFLPWFNAFTKMLQKVDDTDNKKSATTTE